MNYQVSNITELESAIAAGAAFSDTIYLQDGTDLRGADVTEELDCRLAVNAHAVVDSSLPAWFVFEYDCSLTIRWDGTRGVTFGTPFDGVNAVVRLVGWPNSPETEVVIRVLESRDVTIFTYADDDVIDLECIPAGAAQVLGLPHYDCLGEVLVANGAPENTGALQSWDLLDALFPDNPHLWNTGKYLTRFGRKGDAGKRVEDLRKAATYLERAIKTEENHASWRPP